MTVINQVMVEMVNVVARGLEVRQATSAGPTTPSTTSIDNAATPTQSSSNNNNNTTTQSPLLFFVALGFGVVFTNLWYASDEDRSLSLPLTAP
jgi:hypothetical protein